MNSVRFGQLHRLQSTASVKLPGFGQCCTIPGSIFQMQAVPELGHGGFPDPIYLPPDVKYLQAIDFTQLLEVGVFFGKRNDVRGFFRGGEPSFSLAHHLPEHPGCSTH
uniref:(northern house mosquito) hypothetical protein n=1 Tax=Culex pipiens TaxID=7175 RepID=A0A8D8A8K2_CULPI